MSRTPVFLTFLLLVAVGSAGCVADRSPAPSAELILHGGIVETLDPEKPRVTALAAQYGRIVAIGDDDEILSRRGPETRVVDLDGRLAIPGFIEGHGHFTGLGRSLTVVDLRDASSWSEVVERVARAVPDAPRGAWIVGFGWHQDKWTRPPEPQVEGYPVHDRLSAETPDHPVLLKHAAGSHACMVNGRALELLGIGPDTPDPLGGTILRDADGDPTGLLRETATRVALLAHERSIETAEPAAREAFYAREIELANQECLSRGITSFQDAGSDFATVERLRQEAEAGRLGVRLWVMLSEPNEELENRLPGLTRGGPDDLVRVGGIKRSIDGALGSHGAWLLEPYADLPESRGLNTEPLDDLRETARIAAREKLQLCVHAIGDRGARETLDLFEEVLGPADGSGESRWRIEHAQHLDPADLPRFAELGVIASIQSIHCTSDGPWVPTRIGDRRAAEGAYVWRKLIDAGARLVNGTDAPVEPVDPIANFHAAVTRLMADGRSFYPNQRLTRAEALRSYTLDAAYAAFEEKEKGSLSVGKLADVTVLSENILTVPDEKILDAEVLYTIVGGRILYQRGD